MSAVFLSPSVVYRIEPRHEPGSECCRKSQPVGSAARRRANETSFDKRLSNTPRLTLIHAHDAWKVFALELAVKKDMIEDQLCFFMHSLEADFIIRPTHDSRPKLLRPHQGFHKFDLIKTYVQKEAAELSKRFLRKGAPAIEIVPPRQIASHQMRFVFIRVTR